MSFILTCEHAVNAIPDPYRHLFRGAEDVLDSHRGIDLGAAPLAIKLSQTLGVPLFTSEVSRLLVELNRSLGHPQVFSEFTETLSEAEKKTLIKEYYLPYRHRVEQWIKSSEKPVVHFSIHSFTPVLNGFSRDVDIGLLFDPERKFESKCCSLLRHQLELDLPDLQIRYNEPYLGIDDGFTTYLRTHYDDNTYAGIEIEVNQKYVGRQKNDLIRSAMSGAIELLREGSHRPSDLHS